jgi:hypothetical protein
MDEPRSGMVDPEHPPLAEVLQALGDEFMALGQFTENFQISLSPALLRVANDPECHRNVQTSQRLAALSGYVLNISRALPTDWRVNSQAALRNISLSDLAYRLQGAPIPEQVEMQSGALELF